LSGSTIYEYGDFGGLLILAQNQVATNTIYYSLNGGETFRNVTLPESVMVNNIITISPRGERVIVLGYDPDNTRARRFWGIDFSQIHENNCTEADYEFWEPHDGVNGPKCVLGHDVLYRRRKRDSLCYTDDGLNHIFNKTNCVCTKEDYECDFGYERTVHSNNCTSDGDFNDAFTRIVGSGCREGQASVNMTTGYRKVPGDTCAGEIEAYAPKSVECARVSFFTTVYEKVDSLPTAVIVLLVIGFIVVLLGGMTAGVFIALRSQWFRRAFPSANLPAWVAAGYSNQLVDQVEVGPEFNGDLDVALDDEEEIEEL
jgi:hypothetical protein